MRRREALALLGAGAASLAGCTDGLPAGASPTPTESPAATPTESPTPAGTRRVPMGGSVTVGDATVTVANPRVRKTVVQDNGIWQTLLVDPGQFVVVDVTTEGALPERFVDAPFRSVAGGDPLPDGEAVLTVEGEPGAAPRSPRKWDGRRVAFPFPADRPASAGVRWRAGDTDVVWDLPASVRETLAAEPVFRVENVGAVRRDGRVDLDLTVANEGDRDGRFMAWVSFQAISDASSVVEFGVPAGGSREYSDSPPILDYFEHGTVTVVLPTGDEGTRVELEVPEPRKTATGSRD